MYPALAGCWLAEPCLPASLLCPPPLPPLQVYNSPAIPAEVLREVGGGMGRVYALFDRHLRTFLTLLPAQSHLDLRFFLSRFEQQQQGAGGAEAGGSGTD